MWSRQTHYKSKIEDGRHLGKIEKSPYLGRAKTDRVQRQFTNRLAGLKMSYRDRLRVLGLESLERRRLNYDLILVYKILHGLIGINLSFQP